MAKASSKSSGAQQPVSIAFDIAGASPLLMHNVQLADPLNPYARQLKELNNRKKSLTVEEHAESMAAIEFEGGLYWDDEMGPYLPGFNLFKSIIEGGRMLKLGTAIDQAIVDYSERCRLLYSGGSREMAAIKTTADLRAAGYESRVPVKVGTAMVMRTRPQFPIWGCGIVLTYDPGIITADQLVEAANAAGAYKGVGDGRLKGYGKGRYTVKIGKIDEINKRNGEA